MSDLPQNRFRDQLRTQSRPAIIAAVFLGLHVLPLFWRPNPMWGLDFLVYMPLTVRGIFILLAILLFIPGFRRQIGSWVDAFPIALWDGGRRVWVTRILAVLLAFAAFIALSSARHFLGDGYHLIKELDAGTWKEPHRAPLTYAAIRALHHAGNSLWQTAENTHRVYSYVAGVLYVVLVFPVAGTFGKNKLEKSIVLAFLLTTGYMQLFFGYVENYALYMPGLLLYLLAGLRTLQHRLPLFVPALLLGILLALHQAFAVFGPSLLYLAYRVYHHRQDIVRPWKNTAVTVAALCCVPLSMALFLALSGVGFEAYAGRMGGRNFLPIFAQPGIEVQYRIFSISHVLHYLNQQLLAAPAACISLFLVRREDLRRQPFLAICTVVSLLFTFIANPESGAARDWDIFSLPALPLTLWAASAFLNRMPDRPQLFHGAFFLCGSAVLHTLLWIALNANPVAAEARFVHVLGRVTGYGAIGGWLTLGNYYRQQDNIPAAVQAYKRSRDANPTDPNRWLSVGVIFRKMGRTQDAIQHFQKAVDLQPNLPVPYMNLGAAHSDLGQFAKAIEFTGKAIAIDPNMAAAHMNLGAIYRKIGQFDKSLKHLERAAVLQPKRRQPLTVIWAGHTGLAGQHARAILHLEKAVTRCGPGTSRTLVDLAVWPAVTQGRTTGRLKYSRKPLVLQPRFAAEVACEPWNRIQQNRPVR